MAGNDGFTAALHAQATARGAAAEPSGDLASDYGRSVRELLDAFRRPGTLERMVSVPFDTVPGAVALHLRITELLVHGWDLARATGQAVAFPEDVAEQELAFSRGALGDVPPGRRLCVPRMSSIGCELDFDGWRRARRASGTVTLPLLYRAFWRVLQLIP